AAAPVLPPSGGAAGRFGLLAPFSVERASLPPSPLIGEGAGGLVVLGVVARRSPPPPRPSARGGGAGGGGLPGGSSDFGLWISEARSVAAFAPLISPAPRGAAGRCMAAFAFFPVTSPSSITSPGLAFVRSTVKPFLRLLKRCRFDASIL